MNCTYCGKYFEKGTSLGGHIPRCIKNPSFVSKKKVVKTEYFCECGEKFSSGLKYGGHKTWCKLNENRNITRNKISEKAKHQIVSEKTKKKISKTIIDKIKKDDWHLSFSKSRTIEYNGIKFQGNWEVEYAKYLDRNKISWRRPTESFEYEYDKKKRRYTPDFYLVETNEYVEIKGYPTNKDFSKWDAFPLTLKILTGKDLFNLQIIDSYKSRNIEYKNVSWK